MSADSVAMMLAIAVTALSDRASADDRAPVVFVGARVGAQSLFLEGDSATADLRGLFIGVDASLRVTSHVSVAAVVEATRFDARSDRLEPGGAASSLATFAELRIDTNPEGDWTARIDLGTGVRWLRLPLASAPSDTYWALEPLRLRIGPAHRFAGFEASVAAGLGFGWFVARPGDRSCAVTGACADSILESDTASGVHFVGDLSATLRGSL
ncbi:MAG: hypothetical protein ACHREM_03175 [Polyangiales bacterium]